MESLSFRAKLERDKDGTWWFVHVPAEIRTALKAHERRGIIPVMATIGATGWAGSMLPWADGSAQISVGKAIRKKEGLELGQELTVTVVPRSRE